MTIENMQYNPLVSIIIPAYNSEQYVEETIESAIRQSYKNTEIIIVEDGSTDKTPKILEKWHGHSRVRIFNHPGGINQGVSKTRKLGIENANGDLIAFLDADDVFFEDRIEKQVAVLHGHEDVVLVHSNAKLLNETQLNFKNEFKYNVENIPYRFHQQNNWLKGNHICNSSILVRSEALKNIKFEFPQAFQFEDWLTWSLLSLKGNFYFLNEPLVYYRLHNNSATANILKQDLLSGYSKIEYLLTFYLALNNNSEEVNKKEIIDNLQDTLIHLLKKYENNDKWIEFQELLQRSESGKETSKKYNELLLDHEKLLEEYSNISRFKHSKIYRLFKFFQK